MANNKDLIIWAWGYLHGAITEHKHKEEKELEEEKKQEENLLKNKNIKV